MKTPLFSPSNGNSRLKSTQSLESRFFSAPQIQSIRDLVAWFMRIVALKQLTGIQAMNRMLRASKTENAVFAGRENKK
jgi:hypothetical protein